MDEKEFEFETHGVDAQDAQPLTQSEPEIPAREEPAPDTPPQPEPDAQESVSSKEPPLQPPVSDTPPEWFAPGSVPPQRPPVYAAYAAAPRQPADGTVPPYSASYSYARTNPPTPPQKPRRAKKQPRQPNRLTGKIVALALVCALLGGIVGSVAGGVVTARVLSRRNQPQPPAQSESQQEQKPNEPAEPSAIVQQQPARTQSTPSSGSAMTPSEVYTQNVSSVVGIANEKTTTNVWGQTSAVASSGSGFIISDDGYVVTNYHVVQGAQSLTVTLHDGTEYKATVVGFEAPNDVALLKIEASGLTPVSVGDSDALMVGDCVVAIGNPLGELTYTMTVGYISAKDREINTDGSPINMLQTDAAINAGNSGGPLFDMNGNVVGITTAKYSGATSGGAAIEGLGFAIPINDVMQIVPELQAHGYVSGKAYLGVTVRDLDRSTAEIYGLPLGAYVLTIEQGSSAETAGMKTGDLITGIDDTRIESSTDLSATLKNYSAGDTAKLSVYRNGETLEFEITFDEKPQDGSQTTQTPKQTEPTPDNGSGENSPTMPFDPFEYFFR